MKYVCTVCGYIYDEAAGDPDNGVAPGTAWADVPRTGYAPSAPSARTSLSPPSKSLKAGRCASRF